MFRRYHLVDLCNRVRAHHHENQRKDRKVQTTTDWSPPTKSTRYYSWRATTLTRQNIREGRLDVRAVKRRRLDERKTVLF